MEYKEFSYNSLEELRKDSEKMNLKLKFSDDLSALSRKVKIGNMTAPNSLAVHPMEGCDGKNDGSPDELTIRRYERFARGGAGLLWFEAVAVVPEGRGNPRHLWIHKNNAGEFKKIYNTIMESAHDEYGSDHTPVCIMQLTHAGRYSKPNGKPEPILGSHNPYLDKAHNTDPNLPVITDEELEQLEDKFVEAALLAKEAGFHGVDIKACHRYLNSELLSSFERKGRYGGDFEGRTRFITNVVEKVRKAVGNDFIIASRMNFYDGIPYPYGWGVDKEDYHKWDLSEPLKLAKILYEKGLNMISVTMGNPYYNPHINRPYDKGGYIPEEHPLEGVARLINGAAQLKETVPGLVVVGAGYSWLRNFAQYAAAANVKDGKVDIVGFGRESFAYPDFANDILKNGGMKKQKVCIACSKCTELMRAGGTTGCVIRDTDVYVPLYKKYVLKKA